MFRQIVSKTHRATPSGVAGLWNLSSLLGFEKVGDVEVYAIDPRTVLRPAEFQSTSLEERATLIRVPRRVVPLLSKGVSELADMDEPGNAWYFGERAEIFDYKLVGEFPTQSGFAALIQREVLQSIQQQEKGDGETRQLTSWEDFLQLTSDQVIWPHRKMPFLFAGRMVEASMAAVYTLEKDGQVAGLLISSESSGGLE